MPIVNRARRWALGVFDTHLLLLQQRFTFMLKSFDVLAQRLRKFFDFNLELMWIICNLLCCIEVRCTHEVIEITIYSHCI